MSRSGYVDDCDDYGTANLYRASVRRALSGKRGQAFLREMARALDAMPVRELIDGDLVRADGSVCAIGAVAVARGSDVSGLDAEDPGAVGCAFNIAPSMAREIVWENDENGRTDETPAQRWARVRAWVSEQMEAAT